MPSYVDDPWIDEQTRTHDVHELQDCSIAVDASYYLNCLIHKPPYHEPLFGALGGIIGIEYYIEVDLEEWKAHNITPFFVFDGQAVKGEDTVSRDHAKTIIRKTNHAWALYFESKAEEAVAAFSVIGGVLRPQSLYPLLMRLLRARGLHFIVSPYNASAQVAYFDIIDSQQCAGILGSQELLLYPIRDILLQGIDWSQNTVSYVSRKSLLKSLNVGEYMFIDALLMTGTSFLPTFPPLLDASMYRSHHNVMDAINVLRTADKSIDNACASFHDMLQNSDPNWLDKYRRARLVVNHFIYIAESGEIMANDFERLTGDSHEYLGLHLPEELVYYVSTGLISARSLSGITHSQIVLQPTTDGVDSDEYRRLVKTNLIPIKEQTFSLIIPRLHRGIQHKDIEMLVWYDPTFRHTINHRAVQPPPPDRVATWDIKETDIRQHFPPNFAGPVSFEVMSLAKTEFVKATFAENNKPAKGVESAEIIISLTIWRFLHLRGYVSDDHTLTRWGAALATSLLAIKDTCKNLTTEAAEVPGLDEAVLLAFELIRFDLLNAKNPHEELLGLALKGSETDKSSLLLLSRCAALLKLRHESHGYTGPLNKNLLAFRSLADTVRETDRDLIEAILASMFLYAQAKREREDQIEISLSLPFLSCPDIAMAIAVKTFLDESTPNDDPAAKEAMIAEFPARFVPFATHFGEDVEICWAFFDALILGVRALDKEMSTADKTVWETASEYLAARR